MSHIAGVFTPMGYSPGTITAAMIFIPLSVWVFATCFGAGKLLRRPILAAILLASILAQVVLLGVLLGLSRRHPVACRDRHPDSRSGTVADPALDSRPHLALDTCLVRHRPGAS
jgi:hypothetical protein